MGAVTFYRLTQYQYDSLVTKNPDAVYLTSDSRMLYVGAGNYSHGTSGKGHVIGGYAARITSYSSTNSHYVLTLGGVGNDDLDMSKFQIGTKIRINQSEDDPDSEDENLLRWQERTILAVNGNAGTIEVDSDLLENESSELDYDTAFCVVESSDRDDTPSSAGDFNFVIGERASSAGSWNTVIGMAGNADGISCISIGTAAHAEGISTRAMNECSHAEGIQNTASGLFSHAEGSGNTASGDSSHAEGSGNTASGDSSHAEGTNTKATGRFSHAGGCSSEANGDYSFVHGFHVIANAKQSFVIGAYGTLNDSPENQGAFAVAGGEYEAPHLPFIFRTRKKAENPEYDSELDTGHSGTDSNGNAEFISVPAYSFRYSGRIVPETLEINDSNAVLDHDYYSRWSIGNTVESLELQNWNDGDSGEVVFTDLPELPAEWIQCGSMENNHPVNILQIEKVADSIFCRLKFN